MNKRHLIRYMFRNENQQVSRLLPINFMVMIKTIDTIKCHAINSKFNISNLINEHETAHNIKFMSEGLIKTYPTNKFINWFKGKIKQYLSNELLNLKFSDIENNNDNEKLIDIVDQTKQINDIAGSFSFIIPFYKNNNFDKVLTDIIDSSYIFGYDLTSVEKYQHELRQEIDVFLIQFEARFSNYKFKLADVLLHIAPLKNLSKIKKYGLVPKSKSEAFKYQDRVYLFNQCPQHTIVKYGNYKMGITNDDGFCVFKINKNILINDNCYKNGKLTFYVDTAFSDVENLNTHAIFTYNNIGLHLIDDYCVIFKKDDINNPTVLKFK